MSIYGEPNACFLEVKVPENAISRGGPSDALSYANFKKDEFSYLNITSLGEDLVDHMPECSFACLKTPPCFSFNIEASPNSNSKLLCELLPSDKYNNTDKFNHSDTFHHFSITVSWINKGKIRKTNWNPNSAIENPLDWKRKFSCRKSCQLQRRKKKCPRWVYFLVFQTGKVCVKPPILLLKLFVFS